MKSPLRIALACCVALACCAGAGCSTLRPITADSGDLADYRAFRVAAASGTRLARAKKYLEQHPRGAFAAEVRATWEQEEPRYFERAQASREGALRYLVDLPDGPHAPAALALLTALNSTMDEAELADIAHAVHRDEVKLEAKAAERREVGEAILGAIGVLLDADVYGTPRSLGPRTLRVLMMGTDATWGDIPQESRRELFFSLPTVSGSERRHLTLEISLEESNGIVTSARISGTNMFVRWAEADQIVKLDASAREDRTEAQVHVLARLAGALERRFPNAECPDVPHEKELYRRACHGWEVRIVPAAEPNDKDVILIRKEAFPARTQSAR